MNPRYRRLLIPGLLFVLLVVVLISSLARRADGAESAPHVVSRMTDPLIRESSGLTISRAHDDLAYTINDSGNAPLVFAVKISTGQVVGITRVQGGELLDTEAISIDRHGTLWVSDTGDNLDNRADAALYALPEPGPGNHTVTARRYPIRYPKGHPNVEALLINPRTDAKFLVSKELFGGTVYALPSTLHTDRANVPKDVGGEPVGTVTDGTFTTDGAYAVLRNYGAIYVLDPKTWTSLHNEDSPLEPQGESIAAEASGRSLLVGSEGVDSELIRVPYVKPTPKPTASKPSPADASTAGDYKDSNRIDPWVWIVGAVVAAGVLGTGVAVHKKRSG
ncbi:MAG: hypothetical protein JWQ70_1718 [Aeromicrobium sp.]|nr:hypothetical protein [Aeromicrobium sp.]